MFVVMPPLPVGLLIVSIAPVVIDVVAVRVVLPAGVIRLLTLRPHSHPYSPVRGATCAKKRSHQYSNEQKLSKFFHAAFLSISFGFLNI